MPDPNPGGDRATIHSIAIITSIAYSIANFRGPLIEAMVAQGIRVHALAPDYDEKTREAVRRLGAEPVDFSLERAGMRAVADFRDWVRLIFLLRRLRPDAVFCYFIKPVIYGSLAAKVAGVRHRFALVAGLGYVYTENGTEHKFRRRLLRWAASILYKTAFRACDRVFFQNDDDVAQFVGQGLIDPRRVRRLNGSGVDLSRLAVAPPVVDPPTFLLMARLLREKGIVEYVEAARRVKRDHPEARFLLLGGTDPNPGALTVEEVAGWASEKSIEWLGHIDDVRPWIAQAGVYVLPSYREGKPRSTQEAMAMARPVITTDVPGCRDTVDEGVNGFLVHPRDSESLAAAMLRFIHDPSLVGSMGRESRRIAEERFDVHKINRLILDEIGIGSVETPELSPARQRDKSRVASGRRFGE